ncbi:MAG: hypothetical protein GX879_04045 [Bacteroidales bacterium]|nr:hypothetical protein [Bacteroidales bacterium]
MTKIQRKLIIVLCISIISILEIDRGYSQNNLMFLPEYQQDSLAKFRLNIYNHNFFKNNEYFNDFVYSYTLLGASLKPVLVYDVFENLSISGGLHYMKYAGSDTPNKLKPLYRIEYKPFENFSLIMGALNGAWKHRLAEQIYRFERHLIDSDEEGVQLVYDDSRYFADLWVNWDVPAFPRDIKQEQLQIGASSDIKLLMQKFYSFSLVAQVLWAHKGGQDLAVTYPMRSFGSWVAGFKYNQAFLSKYPSGISFESLFIDSYDLSPQKLLPYTHGYGIHTEIGAHWNCFYLNLAYWHAQKYFSAMGDPIYQSVSNKWTSALSPEKNIFTHKLAFIKEVLPGLKLSVHYGGFYSFDIKTFDYFYGIHLILNHDVFLVK